MSWAAYVFLVLTALITAYLLWSSLSVRKIKGQSIQGILDALPDLEQHSARAVIYCYSEHCGPCRKMAPDIDAMQAEHDNLFKLDVSQHPSAARTLGIHATPTSLLVEDGKVLKAILGTAAIKPIRVFLSSHAV